MKDSRENIDLKLIRKLKKGEINAFNSIYDQLNVRIYRFIRHSINSEEDTQELLQEVFIKLWEERSNIDLEKSFDAFVYTIAKNKIRDFLRKVLTQKRYIESFINNYSFDDNELDRIFDYRDTKKVITQLINSMPDRRKEAFNLSRFEGKTYKEISSLMNISENTVDTHIRKALSYIREGLTRFSTFLCL